ncbi:MAG: methyltransferase domain-containing protein [Phycisphaerae bacterium]|nr:class I SAM-dependent methyltransferase [Phycisphaerae bacterium]NIU11388.1 class I SAM-dependent methyltransferase [Phycisphaerae bacterium]NIU59165.1 methyltransferase domain-containing protein [Phycisphaerae bacterium]NIW95513.1 methyltransferase domain-containing protein [Phycisphaerae bacterium]NIX26039.1 methyltransferase domain-containing protein [Phycisphaerae bacterium]
MAELNQEKVDGFSAKLLTTLNGSFLSLAISIGHRTTLFETMAALPASTSEGIAEAAGLHERYVREWLGAMVTGRIVEYDAGSRKYTLPAEHAAILTSAAGPNNMARFARVIPLLASVETGIATSFRNGGGVAYPAHREFMGVWAEVNAERIDATLTQEVLPFVPNLMEELHAGIEVLDVGCGDGYAVTHMAKAFPNSRFTGYDLIEHFIDSASHRAKSLGLGNVRFEKRDALRIDEPEKYQLITSFDAFHDMAKPSEVLQTIARSLAVNGTFLMVDLGASSNLEDNIDHPLGPWLYTTSCMHCLTVSLEQNGEGLGAMCGEQRTLEMLAGAGFKNVDVKHISGDPFNNYYVAKH